MNDQTFDQSPLKFGLRAFDQQPPHPAGLGIKVYCLKALDNSATLRMLLRVLLALGYIAVVGCFALLTFAWVVGGRLFQLADRLVHGPRIKWLPESGSESRIGRRVDCFCSASFAIGLAFFGLIASLLI